MSRARVWSPGTRDSERQSRAHHRYPPDSLSHKFSALETDRRWSTVLLSPAGWVGRSHQNESRRSCSGYATRAACPGRSGAALFASRCEGRRGPEQRDPGWTTQGWPGKQQHAASHLTLIICRQPLVNHGADSLHETLPAHEVLRFDRFVENDLHRARRDAESGLGHDVMRTHDGDRDNRHPTLHGQVERSLLERKELSIKGTLPFHVYGHVNALPDHARGGPHGRNPGVPVAPIHRH